MSIDLLRDIVIGDDNIDWIETILDNITFDTHRRNIIKNMDAVDIQAFPGSGKTTVLIAKLAILARKWPFANKGICVLSHTNVARDEIEKRLGNTDVGKRLLRYPHFVGTLHSFFDTYISIPWLRSQGTSIKVIDSSIVKALRWRRLRHGTRLYLEQSGLTEDCCEAIAFPIKVDIGRASPTTNSYTDTANVVSQSLDNGEFTFDEMLLYASVALQSIPVLPELLRSRFPVLFIDEAQDTSSDQWDLINRSFPACDLCIRQCYGDVNQAIFNSYNAENQSAHFPNGTPLTIPDSKRFGPFIASFANRIALTQQTMEGVSSDFSHLSDKHTVFLFDKSKIQSVIPAYISLLFSCFTKSELSDNAKYGCHVIGMVHNRNDINEEHIPRNVHDYWNGYDPAYSSYAPSPRSLIEYFREGQKDFFSVGDMSALIAQISKGLIRYFNIYKSKRIPANSDAFKALCNELPTSKVKDFRKSLLSVATIDISSVEGWRSVADKVTQITTEIFDLAAAKSDFLNWKPLEEHEDVEDRKNTCQYIDESTEESVTLHFGSIHSVKGRTHLSTLVIETFWYNSNIGSLLPWLCGCPGRNPGKRVIARMKCHYVAFTRARALLCVAIPKDTITQQQIASLRNAGWNIVDVM